MVVVEGVRRARDLRHDGVERERRVRRSAVRPRAGEVRVDEDERALGPHVGAAEERERAHEEVGVHGVPEDVAERRGERRGALSHARVAAVDGHAQVVEVDADLDGARAEVERAVDVGEA